MVSHAHVMCMCNMIHIKDICASCAYQGPRCSGTSMLLLLLCVERITGYLTCNLQSTLPIAHATSIATCNGGMTIILQLQFPSTLLQMWLGDFWCYSHSYTAGECFWAFDNIPLLIFWLIKRVDSLCHTSCVLRPEQISLLAGLAERLVNDCL